MGNHKRGNYPTTAGSPSEKHCLQEGASLGYKQTLATTDAMPVPWSIDIYATHRSSTLMKTLAWVYFSRLKVYFNFKLSIRVRSQSVKHTYNKACLISCLVFICFLAQKSSHFWES